MGVGSVIKTWVIIRDPGCVPDKNGPFPPSRVAAFLRLAMHARPYSYIEVVTAHFDEGNCEITVQDGPECLQMLDGRSMAGARRHNERLRSRRVEVAP